MRSGSGRMGVNDQRPFSGRGNGGGRILNRPEFRFGEATYSPDFPSHGPWRARRSHFRLVLDRDYDQRIFEEADDLPRTWATLLWVPEMLAHDAVARHAGRHFWIMPKSGLLASVHLPSSQIATLRDDECVNTAMQLYEEYLWGDEALSVNLDSAGRLLIGLANRVARRGRGTR